MEFKQPTLKEYVRTIKENLILNLSKCPPLMEPSIASAYMKNEICTQ